MLDRELEVVRNMEELLLMITPSRDHKDKWKRLGATDKHFTVKSCYI